MPLTLEDQQKILSPDGFNREMRNNCPFLLQDRFLWSFIIFNPSSKLIP